MSCCCSCCCCLYKRLVRHRAGLDEAFDMTSRAPANTVRFKNLQMHSVCQSCWALAITIAVAVAVASGHCGSPVVGQLLCWWILSLLFEHGFELAVWGGNQTSSIKLLCYTSFENCKFEPSSHTKNVMLMMEHFSHTDDKWLKEKTQTCLPLPPSDIAFQPWMLC